MLHVSYLKWYVKLVPAIFETHPIFDNNLDEIPITMFTCIKHSKKTKPFIAMTHASSALTA